MDVEFIKNYLIAWDREEDYGPGLDPTWMRVNDSSFRSKDESGYAIDYYDSL